ncbi:ATP-binding cassette domain-containing protein [uncultured Alteromonas sp.]|jgi:ABC-2 type transport system ATP-binding protein|uniref:ATP-binding cassette domain-containing protein n=1 Tax=uncultured Alteromonas sp. TaxID=179113 RepID=UPI000C462038|nr:ATP-binding cassette domain-containing protein [uncultured Alteromonas sp.]MAD09552.1 ABC transporter ATP-binding protein [Alteromonas sp.]|tara:strand:- start:7304 stop:8041 length:738 start_codon:yes stop_codon:yes gene_type:complete
MSDPVLAVEQLGFSYGAKQALSEVTFSLSAGSYYALLGPNGAGKSTLFSILCQLLQPQSGSVTVNGISAAKKPRQVLKQVGMVFQQPTLDLDLSVEQNLAYHASLHGLSNAYTKQRINEELQRFALSERRKDKVRSLNGGHRRRVEIARALLHQPAILLLDEATVGLDQSTRDTINEHLRQLCSDSGITILSSTHLIDEIRPNDELIVLIKGQIQLQQRCEEAMQALQLDSVQALYRHFHQQGEQ